MCPHRGAQQLGERWQMGRRVAHGGRRLHSQGQVTVPLPSPRAQLWAPARPPSKHGSGATDPQCVFQGTFQLSLTTQINTVVSPILTRRARWSGRWSPFQNKYFLETCFWSVDLAWIMKIWLSHGIMTFVVLERILLPNSVECTVWIIQELPNVGSLANEQCYRFRSLPGETFSVWDDRAFNHLRNIISPDKMS